MSSGGFADASVFPVVEDEGPVVGPGWWLGAVSAVFIAGLILIGVLLLDKKVGPVERQQGAIVIFAIFSVPFALTMVQVVRIRKKIGKATLSLPYAPLSLGFSHSATYQRPLRGGAAIRQIDARLQCVETLVKGKGNTQRTFTAIAYDEPATNVITPMMEQMDVQVTFRIPEAGPATLDESGITIRWMLRLKLTMDGCPNTRSSFEVTVMPVVVKR